MVSGPSTGTRLVPWPGRSQATTWKSRAKCSAAADQSVAAVVPMDGPEHEERKGRVAAELDGGDHRCAPLIVVLARARTTSSRSPASPR